MDRKVLCAKLGLDETATDAQISDALVGLKLSASKETELQAENKALKDTIVTLKSEQTKLAVETLVDNAIDGRKITAGEREDYIKLATDNFDIIKKVLDSKKPYESVENKLSTGTETGKAELAELMKLSGKELYMTGKLERVRDLNPESFKLKYKEAFGVELPAAASK